MRMTHRILLAVAIAVGGLLGALPSLSVADSGRDYPRCINTCNAVRQLCSAQCPDECGAAFPNDVDARNACTNACKDACIAQEKECKDKCQADKNNPSPTAP